MYAKISNNQVEKYPVQDIRAEFPDKSLPATLTRDNLPNGYVVVQPSTRPSYDQTTHTIAEGIPVLDGTVWVQTWTISPRPTEEAAALLAQLKVDAANAIDSAAGETRAKYITIAPGQEGTYMLKAQRARELSAKNYQGPVPILIQAEMDATGATVQQACADILAQEAAWEYKAGQIETARRVGKEHVKAATTSVEINDHRDDALSALAQL